MNERENKYSPSAYIAIFGAIISIIGCCFNYAFDKHMMYMESNMRADLQDQHQQMLKQEEMQKKLQLLLEVQLGSTIQ